MAYDKTKDILQQFNTDAVLGKGFSGEDRRNPKQINLNTSGEYSFRSLQYPEDISVAGPLQHYIVFYINARGKTKFRPEKTIDVDVSSRGQNRVSGATAAAAGTAQLTAAVGTAATTAIMQSGAKAAAGQKAAIATALRTAGIKTKGGAIAVGVGAGVLAGATAAAGVAGLSKNIVIDEPKRLTDAIMLPIDSVPDVKYSMKYSDTDLGIAAGIFGGSSAVDSSIAGRGSEAVLRGLLQLGDVAKIAGLGAAKENILFGAKVTTNPFKEVFFEAVTFRGFTFNYTFLPKSEAEVYNVKRIIDLLKFHMHPELGDSGLFYVYPSEFEMQYYYKGSENPFIHKISTCVLTDMSVKYGGEYFTSFNNGAPAEIRMALTFKEVELLTKERIVKGF